MPSTAGFILYVIVMLELAAPRGAVAQAAADYTLDRERSAIYVVTRRAGLLSFLGHDHAILPREWQGRICLARDSLERATARFTVQTHTLEIDTDSARRVAGLGAGPSPDQRRKLQVKFLDAEHLDAAGHPTLTLEIDSVVTANTSLIAVGRLTMRGKAVATRFPIMLENAAGLLHAQGVLSVTQSSFGIKPESIAGVVRVRDPVEIHFRLYAADAAASGK